MQFSYGAYEECDTKEKLYKYAHHCPPHNIVLRRTRLRCSSVIFSHHKLPVERTLG
jgi:hypothetical protein